MSQLEKINIYIQEETYRTMENDAALFEILKKDGRVVNRNRFLGMIIKGYYELYMTEYKTLFENLLEQICIYKTQGDERLIADRIVRNVIFPIQTKRKGQYSKCLSLKPTNDTENVIYSILDTIAEDGDGEYLSQYFNRMIITYCKKPLYERERIVFKESYDLLIDACMSGQMVTFSTIWDKEKRHTVMPYEVEIGQEEMFNYLICAENDNVTGKLKTVAYRLNRITGLSKKDKIVFFSDETIRHLEAMKNYGVQYAINDDIESCVKLTDKGVQLYNRIYHDRPQYESVEDRSDGHYYHFMCSKDQLLFYFRRFDRGAAEVIKPDSLRKKIIEFHQSALSVYNAGNGGNEK